MDIEVDLLERDTGVAPSSELASVVLHTDYGQDIEIAEALQRIDWNFEKRSTQSKIESIHPYPAKFIPDIPKNLLKTLPFQEGTVVLDPFCGSGTTLVECQNAGVPSCGVDLNPIACLISRVKTSPLPQGIEEAVRDVIERAHSEKSGLLVPSIPNLDHWFLKPVQEALLSIKRSIEQEDEVFQDILKLALSSIIVRVSNQDSDTRYAAVVKNVTREDVFSAFRAATVKIVSSVAQRTTRNYVPARVIKFDTLRLSRSMIKKPVGLVITSPPYPNAYEYWLYHKYRMWWLDYDPVEVKKNEIGARAHFFKKNRHTAQNFVEQMDKTFCFLSSTMVKNCYAAFVVGRSKIHGEIIDNAEIIERAGKANGFKPVCNIERAIAQNRKSFNLAHAKIKTENIVLLRKV